MVFDPLYFLIVGPAMLLALWAQFKVKGTFASASQVPVRTGVTGAEATRRLLRLNGINNVGIEMVPGTLSDHYDPRAKVLRLSEDVFHGRSLAAVGIAAHEVGHAIQDQQRYGPLVIRNGLVPLASVGGNLSMILIMIGMVMAGAGTVLGKGLLFAGIALFSLTVIFQLINLPVEFDASNRAKAQLIEAGIVTADEMQPIRSVLSAAAMTYVAATITAVLTLIYFVLRATQSRN
jgi:uncharacterized protein